MTTCSNCQIETQIENRFCPNCGSQLWISWDGATLAKLFEGVKIENGKKLHKLALYRLWRIGKELGFRSITEYPIPDLVQKGKTSLINVVWKSDEEIEFAFEIRTKAKDLDLVTERKKTTKLRNLKARKKFVVNVSNKSGKAYFNQITGEPKDVIPEKTVPEKAYDLNEIRKRHQRAYASWTQDEDLELTKYYKEGLSVSQLAKKHQRKTGAIRSRLKKLGLEKSNVTEEYKTKETNQVTVLVKSEKHRKICLACVNENGQWIRPIKPGGFDETEIMMNNCKPIQLFDVVTIKLGAPFPINHHKENMLISPRAGIEFIKRLNENEQTVLLSKLANTKILSKVKSREELYDELTINLKQSLVLAGPMNLFEIQCNTIRSKNHPRIWIVRENDKERIFSVTCTDIEFCRFIKNKLTYLKENGGTISSQDIAELKGKQTYFVIGLTGDSLDEDNNIKDGKYAPPGSSIQPRYWPLIVSILTVPNYSGENQND